MVVLPAGVMMAVKAAGHPAIPILGLLVTLIFTPVMMVALTTAVASVYLDRPVTIGDAYRAVGNVFKPVIGTALLLDLLMLLGFIALVVPGIYFAVCWSLVVPVMIVEHRFGMIALRRSRQLVRGAWWQTLGIFLVATLIIRIPAAVLDMLWSSIPALGPILTATMSSIAEAYSLVVVVIYYFDRRCRVEDFDLRLLAEQIRAEGASGAPEMAQAAPAS